MPTETRRQLSETQPLPAVETIADLVHRDPEHVYHQRTRIDRVIPMHQPARQWRKAGLERLLRDVRGR